MCRRIYEPGIYLELYELFIYPTIHGSGIYLKICKLTFYPKIYASGIYTSRCMNESYLKIYGSEIYVATWMNHAMHAYMGGSYLHIFFTQRYKDKNEKTCGDKSEYIHIRGYAV